MYDRKTWVVLAICGVLIALNIHFAPKKQPTPVKQSAMTEEVISDADAPSGLSVETQPPSTNEETVVLENEEVIFTLTNIGAGIKHAEFKKHQEVNDKTKNVLINRHGGGPIGGFLDSNQNLDNTSFSYKLDQSNPGKTAVYIAELPSGLIVKKTYSLEESKIPGQNFFINLAMVIQNTTQANLDLSEYSLYLGSAAPLYEKERPTHTGFFWYEGNEMHFEDATAFKGGWFSSERSIITSESDNSIAYAGVTDQFFSTVVRPKKAEKTQVWGKPKQVRLTKNGQSLPAVRAAMVFPETTLAPASPVVLEYKIYTGPKANTTLRELDNADGVGKGWGEIMQYGWFGFVSRPLNWLLNTLHDGIDNFSTTESWGIAIICLTIIVRILIWPLHAKSTRAMKRMSKLQPKMAELKEKYADDPTKLNTEMMGIYRKYGINPLGGCLPMFIQIPIFFGFFRMLDYAVELRGESFLWVNDLSQPDTLTSFYGIPINILPIVMAATSVIQMAMMPKTGDKMQQRIMMFMPLMFFFFCYNYASALALYWTVQNIFSIGQTYLMNKMPEPELVLRKDGGKKSWVQRMAEKQAEMQKAQAKRAKSGGMRTYTPQAPNKKRPPRTGG
ncbi:MAG: membrane protein insertase YidC [Akkermansiaceae bacterium]|jgi:YidC/Oxa1 family membrane protein insertase